MSLTVTFDREASARQFLCWNELDGGLRQRDQLDHCTHRRSGSCPCRPRFDPEPWLALRLYDSFRFAAPPQIQVQPPNGRTLVNFDTNFYTEQPAFDRTVTLLGRRVDLRIWPSQFRWVFGDGSEFPSTSAGAPYPDLLITHKYLQRGGVSPRVDTTYSARFRVDGGPWRDVDGTVTIPGAPVALRVITATPVLVGSD